MKGRRATVIAGFVACVLLLLSALVSLRFDRVGLEIGDFCFDVSGGSTRIIWTTKFPQPDGFFCVPEFSRGYPLSEVWRDEAILPQFESIPGYLRFSLPIWISLCVVAIPTVWLWRLDRRRAPSVCRCGYELTGNMSGRCPECGRAIEPVS